MPPTVVPFPPVPRAVGRLLDDGFEAGRRVHGALPLPPATFRARTLASARARLAASNLPESRLPDVLAASRLDDSFLAVACDEKVSGAWDRFVTSYRSRLIGAAVSFGARRDEAEELVDLLLGDLCAPPAGGSATTRMGTFDGSGSLFGWLCAIVKRRLTDRHRARRHESLDDEIESGAEPSAPQSTDGISGVLATEIAQRLALAIDEATSRMTTREALALRLKFREELAQRAIATAMGVGEPRVSQLLAAGLEKIRQSVRRSAPEAFSGALASDSAWIAVRHALEEKIASFGGSADLPPEGA